MPLIARLLAVAMLSLGLGGCFEVSGRMDFNEAGGSTTRIEIAIPKSVADELAKTGNPGKPKKGAKKSAKSAADQNEFGDMCRALPGELKPKPVKGKSKAAPPSEPPASTFSAEVSMRDDKIVCSIIEVTADPVKSNVETLQRDKIPAWFSQLDRLASGDGYRLRMRLSLMEMMANDKTVTKADRAVMRGMVAAFIEPEMVTTMTISGRRIENSNGDVSADGASVTWKLPLAKLFDPAAGAAPVVIEADILFK